MAFSSSVIAKSFPTYGPYIASKAGVEGLVHVLTNELRGRNITVNAVAPGPIPTELFLKGRAKSGSTSLEKCLRSSVWINPRTLRASSHFWQARTVVG